MARPLQFDRKQALDLIMNEIWRNGYQASSIKALSEKLGITRSSFYNAFGTREQLFDEVMALYSELAPNRALATASPDMAVKKLLSDTFHNVCASIANDPLSRGCLAINCVAELCGTANELAPKLEDVVLESIDTIKTVLKRGVASGEIDAGLDINAVALSLQNLLAGLSVMGKIVHDEADLWSAARTTLRGLNLLDEAS